LVKFSRVDEERKVTVFHYDALDTLVGHSTADGQEQRFYRNNELVAETNGTDSTTFVRAEGVVLAEHPVGGDSGVRLLVGDDKNSVLGEISQQGITHHAYFPYGYLTDAALANSLLGYNGERREGQTGWYLLGKGYRVFNPLMMRFHSPDNLSPFGEGGLNAYMYCAGDPINHVDPTGHNLVGTLLRAVRKTTASADYLEDVSGIPRDLLRTNPAKSEAASIKTIRPKDVDYLKKRKNFYSDVAAARQADLITAKVERSAHIAALESQVESSLEVFVSVNKAYRHAKNNIGRLGRTRHSTRDFKIIAAAYDQKISPRSDLEKYFKGLNLGEEEMKNIRQLRM